MAEHEVTLGEVYRLVVSVREDLRAHQRELVGRKEYQSDQVGTDRRFQELAADVAELKAEIAASEAGAKAKSAALALRMDEAEKEQRRNRQSWTLALVGIVATAILGPIATILIQGST